MKIKIRQFHNKAQDLTITATMVGNIETYTKHSLTDDEKMDAKEVEETFRQKGWEMNTNILTIEI